MMCRGLTTAGGYLPPSSAPLPAGRAVAIFCEGKVHAAGIGVLKMDTETIKEVNKDIGVERGELVKLNFQDDETAREVERRFVLTEK